jgi:hypothetical protein
MRDRAPPIVLRIGLSYAAAIAAMNEEWEVAARALASAMADGILVSGVGYALYLHWLPKVRDHIARDRARELRDEGRALSVEEAFSSFFEAMSPLAARTST